MSLENLLTVSNVAEELKTGKATVKFILKRFSHLIPGQESNGRLLYPISALATIAAAREHLDMGIRPSEIEDLLQPPSPDDNAAARHTFQKDDIRLSHDGLNLLKSLFHDIGEQQKRIAIAHEKRADAEERKAEAIEKRAAAEEKKAEAMNNIAIALQDMNQLRSAPDPVARQITQQAASIISDDTQSSSPPVPNDTDTVQDTLLENTEMDDLASLIDDENVQPEKALSGHVPPTAPEPAEPSQRRDSSDTPPEKTVEPDDLSALIAKDAEAPSGLSQAVDGEHVDNLYDLINDASPPEIQIDDLSQLIKDPDINAGNETEQTDALDDLSQLINAVSQGPSDTDMQQDMDDLSLLIQDNPEKAGETEVQALDDLSLLLDTNDKKENSSSETDDLSLLVDDSQPDGQKPSGDPEPDDLSELIDRPQSAAKESAPPQKNGTPVLSLDIRPADDIEKYKSAIMKIIIGYKSDGLTPEQTTDILNKNKVETLSGKPKWSQKAISQIYGFIESAS